MNRFEKYYPYQGESFRRVMALLAEHPLAQGLFPELSPDEVRQRFAAYRDVRDFQADTGKTPTGIANHHTQDTLYELYWQSYWLDDSHFAVREN